MIQVRTQKAVSGKRWGVYDGKTLLEGGFFTFEAAEESAREWRKDLAEDGERKAGWDASR